MVNRNPETLRDKSSQAAIGVSENQQPLGAVGLKQWLDRPQHLTHLITESSSANAEMNVRRSNVQFAKKKAIERINVVLARMYEDMIRDLVEQFYDETQADDFRPGP
jgi:hypothetical protein